MFSPKHFPRARGILDLEDIRQSPIRRSKGVSLGTVWRVRRCRGAVGRKTMRNRLTVASRRASQSLRRYLGVRSRVVVYTQTAWGGASGIDGRVLRTEAVG